MRLTILRQWNYINHRDLKELTKFYPYITAGETVECYLLEIKEDMGKSVKIFKPFKKLLLKIEGKYIEYLTRSQYSTCLILPEELGIPKIF